jgi:8-oxo-dGTP pyrophosphatase MutT (NUDIX family)
MSNNSVPNQEMHRIVTTVIIYRKRGDDFEFLITKRSPHKKAWPNLWTVPGGGLETDDYTKKAPTTGDVWYEALDATVRREIREEAGLEIGHPRLLVDMTFIRPDNVPVLVLSYYAPYVSGEVKLDEDAVDSAWVTLEEAKDYELIDGIWSEIQMADKLLKGADPESVHFEYEKAPA